jgi:hypothetical protein
VVFWRKAGDSYDDTRLVVVKVTTIMKSLSSREALLLGTLSVLILVDPKRSGFRAQLSQLKSDLLCGESECAGSIW